MSNSRMIVLPITHQGLTKQHAAAKYGVTLRWVNILLKRFREGGFDALQPRSRKPHSNPQRINPELRARIIELRADLTGQGFDAGPISLGWALRNDGWSPPATSTIRRVLVEESPWV